ncbi:hypothetical protein FA13DRAFT_685916 [Coprinellus micaceus]|uniref:Uncharacterized protein n=1 Tax=Coprinellus micaceus TaxID=71717 RepID=A0A4Y7T508_COPMI|nr:hypothetical protein FA13DRAFT_685916 [Coprinellus micaceus]
MIECRKVWLVSAGGDEGSQGKARVLRWSEGRVGILTIMVCVCVPSLAPTPNPAYARKTLRNLCCVETIVCDTVLQLRPSLGADRMSIHQHRYGRYRSSFNFDRVLS